MRDRTRNRYAVAFRLLALLPLSIVLNAVVCYIFIEFLCIPDWGISEVTCLGVALLATGSFLLVVIIYRRFTWLKGIVLAVASALPVALLAAKLFMGMRESMHEGRQSWMKILFGTIPASLHDDHMLPSPTTPEEVWSFHMSDDEVRGLMINGWRMQQVTRATLPDKADLLADPKYLTLGSDEQIYWVQIDPSDMRDIRTLIWSPSRHECWLRLQDIDGSPGELIDNYSGRKFELKTVQDETRP